MTSLNILTKEKLDKMVCADPKCEHKDHRELYFHSKCHVGSPTWVCYNKDTGLLHVKCSECERIIAHVKVA